MGSSFALHQNTKGQIPTQGFVLSYPNGYKRLHSWYLDQIQNFPKMYLCLHPDFWIQLISNYYYHTECQISGYVLYISPYKQLISLLQPFYKYLVRINYSHLLRQTKIPVLFFVLWFSLVVCSCQAARHTCVLFIFGDKNKIMGLIDKVFLDWVRAWETRFSPENV